MQREFTERYPQLSFVDTDVRTKLINGRKLTMRQELTVAKADALATKKRLTSQFWLEFTARWVGVNSPEAALVVGNPAEVVEPSLLAALATARSANTKQRSSEDMAPCSRIGAVTANCVK